MALKEALTAESFDLHIHTTASDGDYLPEQVVQKAADAGLKTIAITDHDTLDGVKTAQESGRRLGIEVIQGVELSTKYKGKSIDILGYGMANGMALNEVLAQMREGRKDRAKRIVEKFTELGMPLTLDDVKAFSKDGVVARPHIAKAVVHKGYVQDVQTVFDEYLADGKPCALDKVVLSPQQGIDFIHEAGGEAVLAHPIHIHDDDFVKELLKTHNFDGLEVWHREQNQADNQRYQKIAEAFGLMMSGGSDFHNDQHQLGRFGFSK